MKLIVGTTEVFSERPCAITLGKFDGIHRGHQKLIGEVVRSKEDGLCPAVFTFIQPPKTITEGKAQSVLLTNREKRSKMETMGVELMIEFPFTKEVHHMEAEAFVEQVLVKGLKAKKIVTGPDYRFGYERRGNVELLKKLADQYGYEVVVFEKETAADGAVISSSLIREEIAKGDIVRANELLGYPYTVTGKVVHGNHLGRTFGMPTINQIPDGEKLLPPNGVYTSMVEVAGKRYHCVSNVGYKPTIEGNYPKGVETYIFQFDQDVYGMELDVELYHFERPEQKFDSVEALKKQLEQDVINGEKYFREHIYN